MKAVNQIETDCRDSDNFKREYKKAMMQNEWYFLKQKKQLFNIFFVWNFHSSVVQTLSRSQSLMSAWRILATQSSCHPPRWPPMPPSRSSRRALSSPEQARRYPPRLRGHPPRRWDPASNSFQCEIPRLAIKAALSATFRGQITDWNRAIKCIFARV